MGLAILVLSFSIKSSSLFFTFFNQFSNLNLNKFTLYIPQVPKDDYFWMRWVYTKKQHRLMTGYQKRSWGIGANPIFLNVEELATIWHFPPISIKAPLVKKSESKRAEPPSGLPITYSDEPFPGFVPPGVELESEGIPHALESSDLGMDLPPPGLSFSPVSDEPLPEALPHPNAPVAHKPSLQEEPIQTQEADGLVPPNLPI